MQATNQTSFSISPDPGCSNKIMKGLPQTAVGQSRVAGKSNQCLKTFVYRSLWRLQITTHATCTCFGVAQQDCEVFVHTIETRGVYLNQSIDNTQMETILQVCKLVSCKLGDNVWTLSMLLQPQHKQELVWPVDSTLLRLACLENHAMTSIIHRSYDAGCRMWVWVALLRLQ